MGTEVLSSVYRRMGSSAALLLFYYYTSLMQVECAQSTLALMSDNKTKTYTELHSFVNRTFQ